MAVVPLSRADSSHTVEPCTAEPDAVVTVGLMGHRAMASQAGRAHQPTLNLELGGR